MTPDTLPLEQSASLPLFYQSPVLLRFEEHRIAGLKRQNGFPFARDTIAVPLCIGEFTAAVRHYPIVFTPDDHHTPLAVLGVQEGKNLFVNEDGSWKAGFYVPAYVRRYPFIVTDTPDQQSQLLAIDGASERFVIDADKEKDVARLFDDEGGPTSAAQEAMTFCHAFHSEHMKTTAFSNALASAGLLTANHAQMQLPNGNRYSLDGFMVVEEQAYRALPAETLVEWQANGWLDPVALHLASRQNWQTLLDLQTDARKEAA